MSIASPPGDGSHRTFRRLPGEDSLPGEGRLLAEPLPSSFRDPAGFVFRRDGLVYRQMNSVYDEEYRHLMESGLYEELTGKGLLLPHVELGDGVLLPEQLDFVSYPYEWCFGQWKDAALATLELQTRALDRGMSLKDASAFNIQFHRGRPVLVDTFSFERYREGEPWVAYRQFCEHFLAPLALMAHRDIQLGSLLRSHLGGVPLPLAAQLLPWKTRLQPLLYIHLHLQARMQEQVPRSKKERPPEKVSLAGLRALLDSLQSAVRGLNWTPAGTVWGDYYHNTNYTPDAMEAKARLVLRFLEQAGPLPCVWDFGANDARFSRLAAECGAFTVAWDADPAAVEKAYRDCCARNEQNLLPLCQDLMNPSPEQGWAQQERMSLLARGPADCVLALALVHHLAIGNNVPLSRLSEFFAAASRQWLIVEFVPREDSQVQRLLEHRRDVFDSYHQAGFESAFDRDWEVCSREQIPQTGRTLYLLRKRHSA